MEKNNRTVERVFNEVLPNPNFMTPEVLDHIRIGDYGIELALGTGFKHEPIYGVTVINLVTKSHDKNLSKCLFSKREVNAYLLELDTGLSAPC